MNPRKPRSDKGVARKDGVEDHVVSFKLNRLDEYEGEALQILEHYEANVKDEFGRAYPRRTIMAAALHALSGNAMPPTLEYAKLGIDQAVTQFNMHLLKLEQIIDTLNELGVDTSKKPRATGKKGGGTISRDYLANLRKAVRGDDDDDE